MPDAPSIIDRPSAVRRGADFDTEALRGWLDAHLPELTGDVSVEQFPSGYSNLTYLVRVGDRELVLRRAPPGVKIKSAHDMGREFRILSGLGAAWDKAPRPLGQCEDASVIGSPFYVMDRVRGVILRGEVPEGLELGPGSAQRVSEAAIDTLAEIHTLDLDAVHLRDLGKPEGYVARQIGGWARRYGKAKTDDISAMDRVAAWLEANMPAESGACLVHNDFKYDNLMLDADGVLAGEARVIAVLDWEMATVGDPLMDLGVALAYWIQADDPPALQAFRFGLTHLPGTLRRGDLVARYVAATGRELGDVTYYYVYALYKIAVVLQQLYTRHAMGLSSDPRHAGLIDGVRGFAHVAQMALTQGRIEGLG